MHKLINFFRRKWAVEVVQLEEIYTTHWFKSSAEAKAEFLNFISRNHNFRVRYRVIQL